MGLLAGKLFDFNGDNHVDFGEQMLGVGAVGVLLAAAEADEEPIYDERESLLENMETQLEELDTQMPDDPDSAAYRKWEKRSEDLEQKIEALAEEIYG